MAKEKTKKISSAKKDKEKPTKEEVCETFEIEKDGKEKTVTACGIEEEKAPTEEQLKKEKKIFVGIGLVLLGFILMFGAVYLIIYLTNHFQVEGVNFEMIKQGQLTLYKTVLPVVYQGKLADYNVYFRTDPRKLVNVLFDGTFSQKTNIVLNMTQNFNCDGDGVISIANLLNVEGVVGAKVIKDENASCDLNGRYTFLKILEGNETKIEQFGPSCYNVYVNGCEILPATEKYLLETIAAAYKK